MAADDLVLALTGASGAPYGVRLLESPAPSTIARVRLETLFA